MPEIDPIQTNFTSGELSPNTFGRVDIDQYRNGARQITNFIVDPKGPLEFRGGFEYIEDSNAATISEASRLFDFVPTSSSAYLIELGDDFIKVMDRDGTQKYIDLTLGYAAADIWDVTVESSDNEMFFYHPLYAPRKLVRTDDSTWSWELRDFKRGPYVNIDRNDIELQIDTFVYRVTITTSNTGEFGTLSVGTDDYIEWVDGNDWFLGKVTTVVDTSTLTVEPVSYIVRDVNFDLAPQRNQPATGQIGSRVAGFSSLFEKAYLRFTDANDGKKSWVRGDFYNGTDGTTTLYDTLTVDDLGSSQYYISHDTGVSNNFKPLFSADSPDAATQLTGNLTIEDETNTAVVTATASLFDAGTATSRDINRWLLLQLGSQALHVKIVYDAANTGTRVNVEPDSAPPREPRTDLVANDGKTGIWFLGAFYGQDADADASYPFAGQVYQQRQMLTGTPQHASNIFSSVTGDFNDYAPYTLDTEVLATSGISYKMAGTHAVVRSITAKDELLIGTEGGMFRGRASSNGDPITPTNFRITPEESKGIIIPPLLVGTDLLYIQRSGHRVNQMSFNIRRNGYEAQDTTILADHLFERSGTEAADFCYKQEPISTLWVSKEDGTLTSLTYEQQQDVYAWAQHQLGGMTLTSGDTLTNGAWYRIIANTTDFTDYGADVNDYGTIFQSTGIPTLTDDDEVQEVGFVESVASLPSSDKREDLLYALVQRGDQKTIERLNSNYTPAHSQDKQDMVFLDSSVTIDLGGTPTTVVSDASLARFNGKTVSVVADGAKQPDVTVSAGSITLQNSASQHVHIGWSYRGILQLLEMYTEGLTGTNQGKRRNMHHMTVRYRNSLGFFYGTDLQVLRHEEFSENTRTMNQGPPVETGQRRVETTTGWDRELDFYVVQDLPYPLTILAIMPEINQSR